MALDTLELYSGLLGFWAMGTGIALFAPEFLNFYKGHMGKDKEGNPKPPARITAGLFGCWITGDVTQLISLLVVGEYIVTQMVLLAMVAGLEAVFLFLILLYSGSLGFNSKFPKPPPLPPKADRDAKREHVAQTLIRSAHYGQIKRPPRGRGKGGGDEESQDLVEEYKKGERAKVAPMIAEQKARARKVLLWKTLSCIVLIGVFTAVWWGVDYMPRETKEPPPASSAPEDAKGYLAYALAWFGFCCWVGPRVYNGYDSFHQKKREEITTTGVVIGGLTHFFNIGSIFLINTSGEALFAQAPFIATSIVCVVLDTGRVILKHQYPEGETLPSASNLVGLMQYEQSVDPFYQPGLRQRIKNKVTRRRRGSSSSGEEGNALIHDEKYLQNERNDGLHNPFVMPRKYSPEELDEANRNRNEETHPHAFRNLDDEGDHFGVIHKLTRDERRKARKGQEAAAAHWSEVEDREKRRKAKQATLAIREQDYARRVKEPRYPRSALEKERAALDREHDASDQEESDHQAFVHRKLDDIKRDAGPETHRRYLGHAVAHQDEFERHKTGRLAQRYGILNQSTASLPPLDDPRHKHVESSSEESGVEYHRR
ncbi:hypothetical protein JCM8547_005646 [Rhodosporidiobolus lusitaniae]